MNLVSLLSTAVLLECTDPSAMLFYDLVWVLHLKPLLLEIFAQVGLIDPRGLLLRTFVSELIRVGRFSSKD